jgi:hypothetical protein
LLVCDGKVGVEALNHTLALLQQPRHRIVVFPKAARPLDEDGDHFGEEWRRGETRGAGAEVPMR